MGRPTISYDHKFTDNCNATTGWSADGAHETGLAVTRTIQKSAYFQFSCVTDNVANEYAYYERDITNFTTTGTERYALRWKTEVASAGVGLKFEVVFTDGSQWLVGDATGPEFSTTWKNTYGLLTSGKTVDKIRIWLDDDPDDCPSATYLVYVQYILLYGEDFTFPYVSKPLLLESTHREALLSPLSRGGNISQHFGMDSPVIVIAGTMDDNAAWSISPTGYKLYDINFSRDNVPWRFFRSNLGIFRVEPVSFPISELNPPEDGEKRSFEMRLRKYDEIDGAGQWYGEYYGEH